MSTLISPSGFKVIILPNRPLVYIAGPFFNDEQKLIINQLQEVIALCGYMTYSPSRDGIVLKPDADAHDRAKVMVENTWAMDLSIVCVAAVDYKDSGTLFEMGYMYRSGKPIIAVAFKTQRMNVMLAEACVGFADCESTLRGVLGDLRNCLIMPYMSAHRIEIIRQSYAYKGEVQ